jgi:hypothetical protein
MARKTKPQQPAPSADAYPAWKAKVRAKMQRRDIPAWTLRERELRNLFITNTTPEQAADRAAVAAHNARPPFGRRSR